MRVKFLTPLFAYKYAIVYFCHRHGGYKSPIAAHLSNWSQMAMMRCSQCLASWQSTACHKSSQPTLRDEPFASSYNYLFRYFSSSLLDNNIARQQYCIQNSLLFVLFGPKHVCTVVNNELRRAHRFPAGCKYIVHTKCIFKVISDWFSGARIR